MAAYQEPSPLLIEQGAVFRKTYQYVTSLKPVVPVDITGWGARLQFRSKLKDAAPVLSLTEALTASGQLVISGAQGTVQIYITGTAATSLVSGGVFDLELVDPAAPNDPIRLAQGAYSVSPNVTR